MLPENPAEELESILKRGQELLHELQMFHDHLAEKKEQDAIGCSKFQRAVMKELKRFQKVWAKYIR